jgi:prolipoprotein diacylglyceryltransferase
MSRLIARVVEKKRYTLTVGGAFFAGLLAAPWLVVLVNATIRDPFFPQLPVMPFLAAGAASYVLGEGFGRLACISFGCCYGRPVASLPVSLQRIFSPCAFVFRGPTKKVAYEGHLEGQAVVPIQAITSVVLVATGIASVYLFLAGRSASAFLLAVTVSQAWRCIS